MYGDGCARTLVLQSLVDTVYRLDADAVNADNDILASGIHRGKLAIGQNLCDGQATQVFGQPKGLE